MQDVQETIHAKRKDTFILHRMPTGVQKTEGNEKLPQDKIVESVRSKLYRRSKVGIEKYGTTLERTDIDFLGWLKHFQEELLDGACYAERLIQELQNENNFHP